MAKLTELEIVFIDKKRMDLSVEEIAKRLGRQKKTVAKYLEEHPVTPHTITSPEPPPPFVPAMPKAKDLMARAKGVTVMTEAASMLGDPHIEGINTNPPKKSGPSIGESRRKSIHKIQP